MSLHRNVTNRHARFLLYLVPAVALASPAFGQARPTTLADFQEPGSVIVFPKFVKGTVSVDGAPAEKTEIEVGVVCPTGVTCPEHQSVKLRFHWVCPADQTFEHKFICKETDFDVVTSVNGKAVFDPDGVSIAGSVSVPVPAAPCNAEYLIGWVVNTSDQPIKFNGLIGDAVLRSSGMAVESYRAITIQADPALANGALITTATDPLTGTPYLLFDGAPGHYQAVSGAIRGDVRFANPNGPATFVNTWLILLTLDVRSNQSNFPTEVALDFFNETERRVSTSWEFVCWTQVELTTIDPNLTQTGMGSRKGLFVSGQAVKFPFTGIFDTAGNVTLLGLVQVNEGPAPMTAARGYTYQMYDNSIPIPTNFRPFP